MPRAVTHLPFRRSRPSARTSPGLQHRCVAQSSRSGASSGVVDLCRVNRWTTFIPDAPIKRTIPKMLAPTRSSLLVEMSGFDTWLPFSCRTRKAVRDAKTDQKQQSSCNNLDDSNARVDGVWRIAVSDQGGDPDIRSHHSGDL